MVVVWSGRRDGEGVATSTSVDAIERFRVDFLLAPASSGRRPVCFHFPPGLSLSLSLSLFSAFLFSFSFFLDRSLTAALQRRRQKRLRQKRLRVGWNTVLSRRSDYCQRITLSSIFLRVPVILGNGFQ